MANDHAQYYAEYQLQKRLDKCRTHKKFTKGVDTTWRPKAQHLEYGDCAICCDTIYYPLDEKDARAQPKKTRCACTPCGHWFHHGCISLWQEQCKGQAQAQTQAGQDQSKVPSEFGKCPSCNTPLACKLEPMKKEGVTFRSTGAAESEAQDPQPGPSSTSRSAPSSQQHHWNLSRYLKGTGRSRAAPSSGPNRN